MGSAGRIMSNLFRSRIFKCIIVILILYLVYIFYSFGNKASFTSVNNEFYEKENVVVHENHQGDYSTQNEIQQKKNQKTVEDNINNFNEKQSENSQDEVQQADIPKQIKARKGVIPKEIDVLITFANAKNNYNLREKFSLCVSSLLLHSTIDIVFHIIGDDESQNLAEDIIKNAKDVVVNYRVQHLNVEQLAHELHEIVKPMQELFSYKPGAYYSDSLFFLSIAIHKVMPEHMRRVIMLDADLKFKSDIYQLYDLFNHFTDSNIIGIGRDLQPVYRHTFWEYRQKNPGTRVGEPPPDGLTGFNSGVLLLDLQRMRNSELYNKVINEKEVRALTKKYFFKGHLGDQDFFTLLSMEHEDLFYFLPCTWNRQLCQWWKDKGYTDVFDQYYNCDGKVNIYHGNCNTPIPDD